MFEIIGNLTKAVVGVVIETPVALVADSLTLGGFLNDRKESYTETAIKKIVKNVQSTTSPDDDT